MLKIDWNKVKQQPLVVAILLLALEIFLGSLMYWLNGYLMFWASAVLVFGLILFNYWVTGWYKQQFFDEHVYALMFSWLTFFDSVCLLFIILR